MRVIPIAILDKLVPMAPPCFEARDIWVQFVASAQHAKAGEGCVKPILVGAWNPAFSPCGDCTVAHEREMRRQARCTRGYHHWTVREATLA